MIRLLYLVLCHSLFLKTNEAARILAVFPFPSISHQVVFRPLTQALAKEGHEVTVITPDPAFAKGEAPPRLTEIDTHDVTYNIWNETFMMAAPKGNKRDLVSQTKVFLNLFTVVVDNLLKTDVIKKLIRGNQQFDLLLIEALFRPALVFSYIYKKAPVILVSSLGATPGNYATIGAADHPILYPGIFRQKLYNLSFWEKISELYTHYQTVKLYEEKSIDENNMLKNHFGPDTPTVQELGNNIDLLILNVNAIFEGIRPVPPSVVYMGGLHQKPPQQLPTDIKSYLDSSKNGVIYISFGTNVAPSMLPADRIQVLVKVFSQLPYDVLWKWDKDELPGRTDNIRISKWLPQPDLLRHPKVKLFITQGGLQSTDEAITAGVPLIGVPMLADQWFNVEKYVYHKIGVQLDLETLTEEQLKKAITTVIGDESYRRNIEKLRSVIQDQPMGPLERAMWWIEHVLRHGGAKHLRSPAANMSWAEYLELELVLTVLAGLLLIVIVFIVAIYALYKSLTRTPSVKLKGN